MSVASILGQDHKIDPLYIPDSAFAVPTLSEVLSEGNTSGTNDIILGVPGTSKQAVQNVDVLDAETVRTDTIKQVSDTNPKVVRVEANLLLKEGVTSGQGVLAFEECDGTVATASGYSLTLDTSELKMVNIGTPGAAFGNVLGYDTATGRVQYQSAGGGGGGGIVASVVGGSNITVDNTSPANPVVNVNQDLTGINSLTAASAAGIALKSADGNFKISVDNSIGVIDPPIVYFNSAGTTLRNVSNVLSGSGGTTFKVSGTTQLATSSAGVSIPTQLDMNSAEIVGCANLGADVGLTAGGLLKLKNQGGYDIGTGVSVVASVVGGSNITVDNTSPANPIVNVNPALTGLTSLAATGVSLSVQSALDMQTNAISNSSGVASSLSLVSGQLLLKDQQNTTLSTVPLPTPSATPNLGQVLTAGNVANQDINLNGNSLQAVGAIVGLSADDLVVQSSGTRDVFIRDGGGNNRIAVNNSGSVIIQTNELIFPTRISVLPDFVNLQAATVRCGSTDNTIDSLVEKVDKISSFVSTTLELQAQGTTELTVSASGVEIPTKLKVQEALTYTPTISSGVEVADTYVGSLAGLTVQNKDTGNNSSANVYLSGDNGTETTHYAVLGRNNANYTAGGTNPTTMDGDAECTYLANVQGSVAVIADYLGNNTNSGIHLGYNGGAAAISVKADTGELSLGTTFSGGAYTYNPGTAGQALLSQGAGAPPVWGTVSGATPTLAEVLTEGNVANTTIDMDGQFINNCANLGADIGQAAPGGLIRLKNDNGDLLGIGVNPSALFSGLANQTLRFNDPNSLAVSSFLENTGSQVVVNGGSGTYVSGVCLDVRSTQDDLTFRGMRLPCMTQAQRTALTPGAAGVVVYQTDATTGIYEWNGSSWVLVGSGGGGSQNLSQVLAVGNSAGNQSMTNVTAISGDGLTGILHLGAASGAFAEVDNTLQEVTLSAEKINLDFVGTNKALEIDGNAGTAGQALLSQGPGAAPVWGAAQATQANTLIASDAAGASVVPLFTNDATAGNKVGKVATGITFNDTTKTLATTTFQGALVGNADTATSATTATNIAGGLAGSVPYQTAAGATTLLGVGSAGQVLTVAGGVPSWATPSTTASDVAVTAASGTSVVPLFCDNATPGNKALLVDADITFNPTTNTLTTTTFVGALSGNATTATSAGSAISAGTATNIASGLAGSVPYQTAPGTTTMLPVGTTGQVLTVAGGVPTWATPAAAGGNITQDDTNGGSIAITGVTVGNGTVRLGTGLGNTTSSIDTIAIGRDTMTLNAAVAGASSNNVAIGYAAGNNAGLPTSSVINKCVFIGDYAGNNIDFPYDGAVIIGSLAGSQAKGYLNTLVGVEAGFQCKGDYTVGLGYKAGQNFANCSDAVFIGPESANDISSATNYDGRFVVGNRHAKSDFLNGFMGSDTDGVKRLGFGTNDPQLVRSAVNCAHIEGDQYVFGIYQGMSGFRANGVVAATIGSTLFTSILSTGTTFNFPYNDNLLDPNQRLKMKVQVYANGGSVNTCGFFQLVNNTQSTVIVGESQGSVNAQGCAHSNVNGVAYNTYILEDTFELTDFVQNDSISIDVQVKANTGTHALTGTWVAHFELVRTA